MPKTPKILVVFTGGTIGSIEVGAVKMLEKPSAGSAALGANRFSLIKNYSQRHPDAASFDTVELAPKVLSENMTVAIWNRLIHLLRGIDFEANSPYSGIIITHGTDTLAYTAALLSVVLSHAEKPVVLVSSNEPLSAPAANGHKNFEDAVNFIISETGKTSGVFATYSYDLRKTILYLARHITQSQAFVHRFGSYNGVDFGSIENGRFYIDSIYKAQNLLQTAQSKNHNMLDQLGEMENCVLMVTPYVGLDYSRIHLHSDIKAVLHSTYHSFTVCLDEKVDGRYPSPSHTSADYFYEACLKKNIPVYFSSFDAGITPYETTKYMLDKGAAFVLNSSVELAYAKLLVGHNIQQENGILKPDLRDALELKLL